MKEKGVDGAEVGGFKVATDGWHKAEFVEGIDFMRTKDGEVWQNDQGEKAYKFPVRVIDEDENKDAIIGFSANTNERGGNAVASLLAAAGLWDALLKKFPGDDVTVFDKPVIEGIKTKLPGRPCMVKSKVDKNGFARAVQFASFARYKELTKDVKEASKSKPKETTGSDEADEGW